MSAGLPPMPGMAPIINVPAPEAIPAAGAPVTPPPAGVPPVGAAPASAPVTPPPTTQEFIPAAAAVAASAPPAAQPPIEDAQVVSPAAQAPATASAPPLVDVPPVTATATVTAPVQAPPMSAPPLTAPPVTAPAVSAPPVTIPQAQPVSQPVSQPVAQPATAMTAAPSTGITIGPDGFPQGGTLTEIFSSIGFEGISTDGFGIMPIITLTQGEFQKDKQVIDQEFYAKILSSRPKYLYSYGDYGDKNNSGLFYTYDKVHNANDDNSTLEDFYQLAQVNGKQVTMTEYYEVDAILLANNEAVKLSVPKRGSGSAFVKFLTQCAANRRRPQDAVVKIKRGERVVPKEARNAFYPWAFEIAGWN